MRLNKGVHITLLCLVGACRIPAQSLSLSISSAPGEGDLILSLDPSNPPLAAVQWRLTYPPGRAMAVSITPGPSGTDAGKSLSCASTDISSTCLVAGSGGSALTSGVLAHISITGEAPAPVWLSRVVASSPDGAVRPLEPGGGSPGLQSMTCSHGPAAGARCEVKLSGPAPPGGIEIALSFDAGYVDAPRSVVVPEGATVASFDAQPAFGRPSNSAAIAASLNGISTGALAALPGAGAASGLIAAYGFDEGAGTRAYDYSGGDNTGSVQAGAWTENGHSGGAVVFDGQTTYVDIGDPGSQSRAGKVGSMTWSAWVYPTADPPDDGQIVARSTDNVGWQLKTSPDTGRRTFGVAVGSGSVRAQRYSVSAASLNQWYFVAGVYDAAERTLDIYVNGELDNGILSGSVPAQIAIPAVNANIGKRFNGFFFQGLIDDVRIYDRALSADEVRADMKTPAALAPPPISRLQSLSCAPVNIPAGGGAECTATLSGPAATDGVISLSGGAPFVSMPSEVAIPAGAATASFQITAAAAPRTGRPIRLRSASMRATITATLASDSVSTAVSVVSGP